MKGVVIIDCCGYEIKLPSKLFNYLDCFKLRSGEKFFQRHLPDGREVKKEIMLVGICPHCKHYILRLLFYANKTSRFQDWDDTRLIRGAKADEIFAQRSELYDLIVLPNPFRLKPDCKHSRKIPWVYYKMLPNEQAQIPRYMDESGDAGLKILCPLKVLSS